MKRSKNFASKLGGLLVIFVAAIFVGADLPASAQNSNGNTTGDSTMQQTMNGNMSGSMMGGQRRRARRRARRQTRRRARRNMNANMGDTTMTGDANMNGNMSGDNMGGNMNSNMSGETQSNMNSSMSGGMQGGGSMPGMGTFGDVADLSGTYTGTINYADGGMTGDATLTLTGNTFTITAGSATQSGTLSARSWPGYTAISMRFGDTLPATIISARAWHRGNTLRIQSVRGESRMFTFNGRSEGAGGGAAMSSSGATTSRRSRGRRNRVRRGRSNTMMTTPDAPPDQTPTPGQ
jgi:hypothetical protein